LKIPKGVESMLTIEYCCVTLHSEAHGLLHGLFEGRVPVPERDGILRLLGKSSTAVFGGARSAPMTLFDGAS
jgi:hypothetical protein